MTARYRCPRWCTDPFEWGDGYHAHRSQTVVVEADQGGPGREQAKLPGIGVHVGLYDYSPAVYMFVSGAGGAYIQPHHVDGMAAVLELLAGATPEQHRELARVIRDAARLIPGVK